MYIYLWCILYIVYVCMYVFKFYFRTINKSHDADNSYHLSPYHLLGTVR